MNLFHRGVFYDDLLTDEKEALRVEAGRCEICGSTRDLQVDHDRLTGWVRGILCRWCNTGVIRSVDNGWPVTKGQLAAAAAYLKTTVESLLMIPATTMGWRSHQRNAERYQKLVREEALQLASDAWLHRDVPEEFERIDEIRRLAGDQIADDVPQVERIRVGSEWVLNARWWPHHFRLLQEPYSDDELSLQAAVRSLVEQLSSEERVLVRLTYDAGMSLREVADKFNYSHMTVKRRLAGIYQKLRVTLERGW